MRAAYRGANSACVRGRTSGEFAMSSGLAGSLSRAAFALILTCCASAAPAQQLSPKLPSHRPVGVAPFYPRRAVLDIPASDAAAARFLTMATFGPNQADISLLRQIGYRAWIKQQLALPATLQRPYVESLDQAVQNPGNADRMGVWFNNSLNAPDQLRQRMAWALSHIMVTSDQFVNQDPIALAEYYDILARDAAGYTDSLGTAHAPTYSNLLLDVTLSPAMAKMLTYLRNQKGDPNKSTSPDENYARE